MHEARTTSPNRFAAVARDVVARARSVDARWFQIATLGALLIYGLVALDFDVGLPQVFLTLSIAVLAQAVCSRALGVAFDFKSPLISALSLCLLLRTSSLGWAAAAAALAITSKFVLRLNGKHIFNPTNGAIVMLMLAGAPVWVSAGQWGNVALFGFLMASLGTIVVTRAARVDVTVAFVLCWVGVLVMRSIAVGEPMTIPLHRLQSGGLVLFAFFMVTDPKTTPDSRSGRLLFCALVAAIAYYVQFKMFHTNALLWALSAASLLVPVIDRILPGPRYRWTSAARVAAPSRREPTTSLTTESSCA